jgi:hypothetical protein
MQGSTNGNSLSFSKVQIEAEAFGRQNPMRARAHARQPEQLPELVWRRRQAGGQGAAQHQQRDQVEAGAAQQGLPEEEVPQGVPEAGGGGGGKVSPPVDAAGGEATAAATAIGIAGSEARNNPRPTYPPSPPKHKWRV